jgi:hypothetical protein
MVAKPVSACLAAVILGGALTAPLHAATVSYDLNIVYRGGDTADGSFLYDTHSGLIVAASFITTGGRVFPPLTLTQLARSSTMYPGEAAIVVVEEWSGPDFTDAPGLNLVVEDLGRPEPTYLFAALTTCVNFDCDAVRDVGVRVVEINGEPFHDPIPLPGTLFLLSAAIAGLVFLCSSKRVRARRTPA